MSQAAAGQGAMLSVVIPAYNEEPRILNSLHRIAAYLEGTDRPHEILVVDDGSTDGTARVVRDFAADCAACRLLRNAVNRGKGAAVRRGALAAAGDFILMSDADLSTPIEEVEKLLRLMAEKEGDVAVGSRSLFLSDVRVRQPLLRQSMGRLFNVFVRTLVLRGIQDTQCGFKCFTRRAARVIFARQRIDGFCFDVETLLIARRSGLRVLEVPVVWIDSPDSRVHIVAAPARMFVDLLRIVLAEWQGRYDPRRRDG